MMLKKIVQTARKLCGLAQNPAFNSADYWKKRYEQGLTSGEGSYGDLAVFKADVLNQFVKDHDVRTVMEFGCGDGNQLSLANYPQYLGLDVSDVAIEKCKRRFSADATKSFRRLQDFTSERAELTLSLDVLYHLVEEDVYQDYLRRLFSSADRFVAIYAPNILLKTTAQHECYRVFTDWIKIHASTWKLLQHTPNKYSASRAEFFFYEKR